MIYKAPACLGRGFCVFVVSVLLKIEYRNYIKQERPRNHQGLSCFPKKCVNYIFLVESFLVESTLTLSFFTESVLTVESTATVESFLVESVVVVEPEPLQATIEAERNNATAPNLNAFFI